jgi:excisionase family DNA binding protein
MQQDKYVSTIEVAAITGLDRVQVFRLIKKGTIPAEKVGRNYIIKKTDLGLLSGEPNSKDKKLIEKTVDRVFAEHGVVIRKLGEE